MYKDEKILAIVQARMESSRLPGKALMELSGKPVLEWIIDRLSESIYTDKIAIAIPDSEESKHIVNMWRDRNWKEKCFIVKGSMDDVIGRVISTANKIKIDRNTPPDILVDITADCPLVDPRHVDLCIKRLVDNELDYYSNVVKRTWPDGCDIQVYKFETLINVYNKIENEVHKQHVGWNIIQHPEDYKIGNWEAPPLYAYPGMGITLDTKEDFKLLEYIFDTFKEYGCFYIEDVIRHVAINDCLKKINENVIRKTPGEG